MEVAFLLFGLDNYTLTFFGHSTDKHHFIHVTPPTKMQRRYKTAIRILLVLSVVNFMFAGFAQSRAIHKGRADLVQATTTSEIQPASPERPPANQLPQAPQSPPEPVNPEPSPERPPANQPPRAPQLPPEPANPELSPARPPANQPPHAPEPPPEPANPEPSLLDDSSKFYSKEMEEKFQAYLILGAVEGFIGAIGSDVIQHQIVGTVDPDTYVSANTLMARVTYTF